MVLIKSMSVKAACFPVPSGDFWLPDPVEAHVSRPWCVVELEFQSRHVQEKSQVPNDTVVTLKISCLCWVLQFIPLDRNDLVASHIPWPPCLTLSAPSVQHSLAEV